MACAMIVPGTDRGTKVRKIRLEVDVDTRRDHRERGVPQECAPQEAPACCETDRIVPTGEE